MIILSFGLPVIIFQPLLPALCSNFFSFFFQSGFFYFLSFLVFSLSDYPHQLPASISPSLFRFLTVYQSQILTFICHYFGHIHLYRLRAVVLSLFPSLWRLFVYSLWPKSTPCMRVPHLPGRHCQQFCQRLIMFFFLSMAIQGSVEKLFEKVFFQKYFWNHILTSVFKIQQFTSLFLL